MISAFQKKKKKTNKPAPNIGGRGTLDAKLSHLSLCATFSTARAASRAFFLSRSRYVLIAKVQIAGDEKINATVIQSEKKKTDFGKKMGLGEDTAGADEGK